jgi:hypothetical protein
MDRQITIIVKRFATHVMTVWEYTVAADPLTLKVHTHSCSVLMATLSYLRKAESKHLLSISKPWVIRLIFLELHSIP